MSFTTANKGSKFNSNVPPPPPTMLPNTAVPPPNFVPPPPSNGGATAPSTGSVPAVPAQYQAYMQQYYQYMYSSMYSNPAMMQAYMASNPNASTAIAAAAAASMQNFYNNNNSKSASQSGKTEPTKPTLPISSTATPTAGTPTSQIKFNLKFNQQKQMHKEDQNKSEPAVKKSRFDLSSSDSLISNVTQEQKSFEKNEQEKVRTLSTPMSSTKAGSAVNENVAEEEIRVTKQQQQAPTTDIVYDIKKWPVNLKAYCARVYQHYVKIVAVDEEQVTKYLQKRITDVFQINPELTIDWEKEPVPDLIAIKKVAPFSKAQLETQKQKFKMQLQAQKVALSSPSTPCSQNLKDLSNKKTPLLSTPTLGQLAKDMEKKSDAKKPKSAPKRRSSSSSSYSSSTSSKSSRSSSRSPSPTPKKKFDDYIPLSNNQNKNKRKFITDTEDLSDRIDLTKMSKKQRKKFLQRQQQQARAAQQNGQQKSATALAKLNNNIENFFFTSRKSSGNLSSMSAATARKQIRSFYELEREQLSQDDQDMIVLSSSFVGQSQDLEKQYLRLTGVI
jgi:hypothetical protein